MKAPVSASPFAALSPQEQKERWICWQCRHSAECIPVKAAVAEEMPPVALPALKLPEEPEPESPQRQTAPPIRHGQYDAVIRRMQQAQRRTTAYTDWT